MDTAATEKIEKVFAAADTLPRINRKFGFKYGPSGRKVIF